LGCAFRFLHAVRESFVVRLAAALETPAFAAWPSQVSSLTSFSQLLFSFEMKFSWP